MKSSPKTTALSPVFFDRPAPEIARTLLGKVLVRQSGRTIMRAIIHETEAYDGEDDLACHARFGRTKRNAVMFGPAGRWYVYLCYGMHWMLNIVTGAKGHGAAVLIRGAGEWDGPGKLTYGMCIDDTLNGKHASRETGLWIEDSGVTIPSSEINRTPRIGVSYAGEWAEKPWRFVWEGKN